MRSRNRFLLMRTTALAGAMAMTLAATSAGAQAAATYDFDLAPQPLGQALREFYHASGEQIVFAEALVAGRRSPAVKGQYSSDQALAMLLAGTDLVAAKTSTGVIMVQAPQSEGAAGGGAEAGAVDALIVTAQKREENIQDVPIAISAFSQEDLTTRQVAGGPDLMTQVPNFTFTKTNFASYSIQIRGIGTQAISATTDAAVAVALNNTPFIRNRFFEQEFYDLQRIEVLRGPQGTLYGRNATAGVVNIITAKPSFRYEAKLSGDVANYNSSRLEGMINLPLVDEKVALRVAGAWTKRDGFVDNEITGNPIDGRDLWSTRVSLRIEPTDGLSANLIWEHFEEDDDRLRSGKQLCHRDARTEIAGHDVPPMNGYSALFSQGCLPASMYSPEAFEAPNGFSLPYYHPLGAVFVPTRPGFDPYVSTTQSRDLRVIESTVDPHYSAETDLAEIQLNIDIADGLTLTSETAYLVDDLFSTQDLNRFNTAPGAFENELAESLGDPREDVLLPGPNGGIFCDPQIGCADRLVAMDLSTAKSRHFSQELRLSSNFDGPFNFSLGANYLRYDTEDKYYVFINTLSLFAAIDAYGGSILFSQDPMPAYEMGVSDNHECLKNGYSPPNPLVFNTFVGCVYMDPNPIGSLNDQGHNYFLSRNPYKLISYAAFGEAYYNVTDTLKITGGLRFTVDKKEAPRIPSWVLGAMTVGYPVMEVVEQEWREPTGRLTIDWKPDLGFTDETLLYASYARGYKAGGANPPPAGIVSYVDQEVHEVILDKSVSQPKTFEPEFVNAFEIGAKNTMADGKLTLNVNAFYYDYTGYQISQIVNRSAVNLNFDADVWGLELEADWRPFENLRLGFKGGYENTKVAEGSQAIDLMDRTGGHDDWVVVKPFPTFPSNCVLPVYAVSQSADGPFGFGGNLFVNGNIGPCEMAYVYGRDPRTGLEYVPNPTAAQPGFDSLYPGYIGFNPLDASQGHNNGEGFFTDLSGNELPNAPNYTATITADWTLPLPHDWLMTLHTDLYYQSEAWTRIFNTEGYDKLKAYTNVNLAAIFNNEEAGWHVMAYVKNVMDRDSITGAFLFSDDTGLTTNVFLTEPRLYGLRVTKDWTGGPWWTGANASHPAGEPYPLTIEVGGQVQRLDAPHEAMRSDFVDQFSTAIDPIAVQDRDLDRGDGREIKLSWRPAGPWTIAAGVRFGRTNGTNKTRKEEVAGPEVCVWDRFSGDFYSTLGNRFCDPTYSYYGGPPGEFYQATALVTPKNWSDSSAVTREDHTVIDFAVGRDVGMGSLGLRQSSLAAGLRYAKLGSTVKAGFDGIPDWDVPEGFYQYYHYSSHHRFTASFDADREFKGVGPTVSWQASVRLLGDEEIGHLDVDWTATGGVLFGKQKTTITGVEAQGYFYEKYDTPNPNLAPLIETPLDIAPRSESVAVPVLDLSLGLSYEIQRVKVGAGYRWERYFDALDAGYQEHRSYDRTIDGPYFKVAIGFGG